MKFKKGDEVEIATGTLLMEAGSIAKVLKVDKLDDTYHVEVTHLDNYVNRMWIRMTTLEEVAIDPNDGTFIVWGPSSNVAPTKIFYSHKQARKVARRMAEEHNQHFYVMKATHVYEVETRTVSEVIKREL